MTGGVVDEAATEGPPSRAGTVGRTHGGSGNEIFRTKCPHQGGRASLKICGQANTVEILCSDGGVFYIRESCARPLLGHVRSNEGDKQYSYEKYTKFGEETEFLMLRRPQTCAPKRNGYYASIRVNIRLKSAGTGTMYPKLGM